MQITDVFYEREKQKDLYKDMAVKLAELKNDELIALHRQVLYCRHIKAIRQVSECAV